MRTLTFKVAFDSWFRVGAAYSLDGLDAVVDHVDPLPADHLRGLMRAEASWLASLGVGTTRLVDEVFGTTRSPGAWSWSSATPQRSWQYAVRRRVSIDPETHSATRDHLVSGELVWTDLATFVVTQERSLATAESHERLLRLAGCSVHHVGAWRRRGLGSVIVTCEPSPSRADVTALRDTSAAGQAS